MADVFISYHDKTNGDRAEKIAATLESAGITCWYARRDVPAGGDFTHEVIKQIGDCTVFLLLLDDGAARSPHVETEVANAFGHKKIMPYQTDTKDVKSVDWVQYYLKHAQIVLLPDYDALTKEIAMALGRPVKAVTPKPQPDEANSEHKDTIRLKTFGIVFMLTRVLAGCICGVIIGISDFSSWVSVAFRVLTGYYVGWAVSCIIIRIFFKATHADIDIEGFMGVIVLIWWFIGTIWGAIAGYMTETRDGGVVGIVDAVFGGIVALLVFGFLSGIVYCPTEMME